MTGSGRLAVGMLRLEEIEPEAWRLIAGEADFYLGQEWLRALHHSRGGRDPVLVVWERGAPLGAMPCYLSEHGDPNPLYDLFDLYGAPGGLPESARSAWSPQLLGGAKAGYANRLLVDGGHPQAGEVAAALLAAFRRLGEELSCRSLGLLYFDRAALAHLVPHLAPGDHVLLTSARARLDIRWADFDEYLGWLPGSRRSVVRRDLRALESSGGELDRGRLPEMVGLLAPLIASVQRRHGRAASDDEMRRYLERCAWDGLGDRSVLFLCRRRERVVAFALGYEHGRALFMRIVGLEDAEGGTEGAYFGVLFYEPIRYAIQHALTWIDYGVESFLPKLLRGCRMQPLWSLLVPPPGLPGTWRQAVAGWNARLERAWSERYGALTGPLPAEEWRLG